MQSKKAYELVTTGKAGVPGIPARDGFNGFLRDLPGDRLCCHRRLARLSAKLDASVEASGPHDFAVRVQHRSSAVLTITSIASRPASRDDRERPLVGRDRAIRKVFRLREEARYFFRLGWTGVLRNSPISVIASAAKQSSFERPSWIASSPCSSQ